MKISQLFLSINNKLFSYTHLKGFTAVTRNHSPKPLSNHRVFPRSASASQNDSSCMLILMLVELGEQFSPCFGPASHGPPFHQTTDLTWISHSHGSSVFFKCHRRSLPLHPSQAYNNLLLQLSCPPFLFPKSIISLYELKLMQTRTEDSYGSLQLKTPMEVSS